MYYAEKRFLNANLIIDRMLTEAPKAAQELAITHAHESMLAHLILLVSQGQP